WRSGGRRSVRPLALPIGMVPRRTKILATLGPATTPEDKLRELLDAGADAVRLNFSHGSQKDHEEVFLRVRRVAADLGRSVPVVQDIPGPKIRIRKLPQPVKPSP